MFNVFQSAQGAEERFKDAIQDWAEKTNVLDLSGLRNNLEVPDGTKFEVHNYAYNLPKITLHVKDFKSVVKLNVSRNCLTSLEFLREGFPVLEELNIESNFVATRDAVALKVLRQTLKRLNFKNNLLGGVDFLYV